MDRTGGLDVEREPRPPNPLGGLDFAAAAVARNLELRHRGSLRRRERDFEIPARRRRIDPWRRRIDTVRQRRHLQQGLARDRGVGIAEQMMRDASPAAHRRERWRGNRLRRGQRAAKRRRRRVGMEGYVVVASDLSVSAVVGGSVTGFRGLCRKHLLQQSKGAPLAAAPGPGISGVSGSPIRIVLPNSKVSSATGTRACGRRFPDVDRETMGQASMPQHAAELLPRLPESH